MQMDTIVIQFYITQISVDIAHYEIFRAKIGVRVA